MYRDYEIDGRQVIVTFDHANNLQSRDGQTLTWFEVAGPDRDFHEADAVIEGDAVVVTSDEVSAPVAVRFAWHEAAEPNLVNAAGLPAAQFRTDAWPVE